MSGTSASWPCAAMRDADLSARTTMRVGGRVRWLLEPADPQEFRAAWARALQLGERPLVLGGGANLIVDDGDFETVVISTERLRRLFRPSLPEGEEEGGAQLDSPEAAARVAPLEPAANPRLVAWAGATLPGLVRAARDLGFTGLEGLIGVPGQLGGGVAMNAGGRWGELWDTIERVFVLEPDGEERVLERAECEPRYRSGGLGERLVLGAVMRFEMAPKPAIEEAMRQYLLEKRRAQPVTEASSGCIFQNPDPEQSDGRSAGLLIDQLGGKELSRGDAIVSPLHGNFIVNRGTATARDVLELIDAVRALVAEKSGIELAIEVRRWTAHEGRLRPSY